MLLTNVIIDYVDPKLIYSISNEISFQIELSKEFMDFSFKNNSSNFNKIFSKNIFSENILNFLSMINDNRNKKLDAIKNKEYSNENQQPLLGKNNDVSYSLLYAFTTQSKDINVSLRDNCSFNGLKGYYYYLFFYPLTFSIPKSIVILNNSTLNDEIFAFKDTISMDENIRNSTEYNFIGEMLGIKMKYESFRNIPIYDLMNLSSTAYVSVSSEECADQLIRIVKEECSDYAKFITQQSFNNFTKKYENNFSYNHNIYFRYPNGSKHANFHIKSN